jgi:hypothetical protein
MEGSCAMKLEIDKEMALELCRIRGYRDLTFYVSKDRILVDASVELITEVVKLRKRVQEPA